MIQPVALAERILSLLASQQRLARLVRAVPAYSFPDMIERDRALAEADEVLAQHQAFETPPR
jgi:hypothetical protein